jgi:hypothetical protein
VANGAGPTAPREPEQQNISDVTTFVRNGYRIVPLARYDIDARVLGRKDYTDDRESQVAPVDIAVGWGPMSDAAVLTHLTSSQAKRFFNWSMDRDFPLTRQEFIRYHSNMHIIPANAAVVQALQSVRPGLNIRLRGYLVRAEMGKWKWASSLRRDDTGWGACEIMWVESLETYEPRPVSNVAALDDGTKHNAN